MKFTFGKTTAAMRLEKLVADNPSARRKVSTLLSDYTNQLLLVVDIKDDRTVRKCMDLLRDNTLARIDLKRNLSDDIKTYTKNVVIARHRVFRQGFDHVIKSS